MAANLMNRPAHSHRPLRALVLDDHPIVMQAVATSLARMKLMDGAEAARALFERIDTAGTLGDALQILEQDCACDIVVLDLQLGEMRGRESLTGLRERFPEVPVLVFSGNDDVESITMAFECGARGYATKSSPPGVLPSAVRLVLAGSSFIPPEAASILGFPRSAPPASGAPSTVARLPLSVRQEQVFKLLLQGMPNKVIAARLDMAEGTAKAHLNAVFRMLGVRTRVEAILRARELGLV